MSAVQLAFGEPAVRATDPRSSHEAAEGVRRGKKELTEAIESVVRFHGPLTAFQIADHIVNRYGDRWQRDTIRAQVSRVGFVRYKGGLTPGGRNCCRYGFGDGTVHVQGDVL